MLLKVSNAGGTKNETVVSRNGGALVIGGTLLVTNIGPALVVNNTFQLFPAGLAGFSYMSLPVGQQL